jgi:shikimate 5-dehydrogenase
VGREDDNTPFEVASARADAIIVDLVYSSGCTRLVSDSLCSGRVAIDGREVLLVQVERQFRMMTGKQMPEGLGQEVLSWDTPVAALV